MVGAGGTRLHLAIAVLNRRRPTGNPLNSSASAYLKPGLTATIFVLFLVWIWPREAVTPEEQAAVADGRVIIAYWDRSQGFEHEERNVLIEEYNRTQGVEDGVFVRTLSIGWRIEKLLTAISSGAPPDLCSMEAQSMATLGYQGCFEDLTDWMTEHPYLHPDRFLPTTLNVVTINDRIYGIPTMTDSYCLVWNKALFRRAGLDPERPPETIEELQEYAVKLTALDEDRVSTIGFLPWIPWDMSYMWGSMFGADWYDPETDEFIPDPGPVVEAFRWQASWQRDPNDPNPPAHSLHRSQIDTFFAGSAGGGGYQSAQNPFYSGRVAMTLEGEWQVTFIPRFAPDLDWGVAPMPQPEGVLPRSFTPGAVLDAIPVGSPNPEAAKKFLDWFYSPRPDGSPSPASDYNKAIHNIPCRIDEAMEDRFLNDPKFGVFVAALLEREPHSYPITPASRFFSDRVSQTRERILYGGLDPEEAVEELRRVTNAELRRLRHQLELVSQ